MVEPIFLSISDACRVLGISRGLMHKLLQAGDVPSTTLGARRLIPRWFIDETLARANGGVPVIHRERREVERVEIPAAGDRRG